MSSNTDWFRKSKWGLFVHFLAAPASSSGGAGVSAEEWNRRVDAFDVGIFAGQLKELGAGHVFFTLGQNSGHYCSPNATYDRLVGISPSKCSRRDLISDLHEALAPNGTALMAYLPSGAPEHDSVAVQELKWKKNGGRLAEFQIKWESVIREWSLRWGDRVKGWWIDGCYYADDMYRHDDAPNFQSFARALKAGNPDGIVAFNPGVKTPVESMTDEEDYTAGEISIALPVFDRNTAEIDKWTHGKQYHVLSFLGDYWGRGGPRFPDNLVSGFTKYTIQKGGVVSWDVPVGDGRIPDDIFRQLSVLSRSLS